MDLVFCEYNAGMSRGEDKAKRWQITIRGLLIFTAGICLLLGVVRFAFPIVENWNLESVETFEILVVATAFPFFCGLCVGLYFRWCGTTTRTAIWIGVFVTIAIGIWVCLQIPTIP